MTETAKPGRAYLGHAVLVADLAGTTVFAAEGAVAAVAAQLDLLGICVIAFVTALGGGMVRDVLLGSTPPAALRDQRYLLAVLAAVAAALLLEMTRPGAGARVVLTLDAAGLALFAVAGTLRALELGCRSSAAVMLGTVTATGGGLLRDVLLNAVPAILRIDFYATAALAGAGVVTISRRTGASIRTSAVAGFCACFALRLLAAANHWHLPAVR